MLVTRLRIVAAMLLAARQKPNAMQSSACQGFMPPYRQRTQAATPKTRTTGIVMPSADHLTSSSRLPVV